MPWTVGWFSAPGELHSANEDAVMVDWLQSRLGNGPSLLVAVADGIGGLEGGRDASIAAIFALREILNQRTIDRRSFIRAFAEAHSRVRQLSLSGRKGRKMGTTLVAAVLTESRLWVANVGDSRAYRINCDSVIQISFDHSTSGEQVLRGSLSAEQAASGLSRHFLTRCLGVNEEPPEVDIFECSALADNESVLLCSDGLYSMVASAEVAQSVHDLEPDAAARGLISSARERGGPDDMSLVIVKNHIA